MVRLASDLLLNVLRAADPKKSQSVVQKLQLSRQLMLRDKQHNTIASGFNAVLSQDNQYNLYAANNNYSSSDSVNKAAYRKFESFMLQSFVEKMFTSDASAIFGKGQAGKIWRSMMAESIGDEMARAGGVGIANMLERGEEKKLASQRIAEKDNKDNRDVSEQSDVLIHNIYSKLGNSR